MDLKRPGRVRHHFPRLLTSAYIHPATYLLSGPVASGTTKCAGLYSRRCVVVVSSVHSGPEGISGHKRPICARYQKQAGAAVLLDRVYLHGQGRAR